MAYAIQQSSTFLSTCPCLATNVSDSFICDILINEAYPIVRNEHVTFELPPDCLPGKDSMRSRPQKVMDLLTLELLDTPGGTYNVAGF